MYIINWLVCVELVKMGIDVDVVLEQLEVDNVVDLLVQEEINDSKLNQFVLFFIRIYCFNYL